MLLHRLLRNVTVIWENLICSCFNVMNVKSNSHSKCHISWAIFLVKPDVSIIVMTSKRFSRIYALFLSYPPCSSHKTVTYWATSVEACSKEERTVVLDEMMKGNKTSRQMRQKIHKWNIKKRPWVRKWNEKKRERGSGKDMQRGRAAWSHLNSDWQNNWRMNWIRADTAASPGCAG